MRKYRAIPGERTVLRPAKGLLMSDELTGAAVSDSIRMTLEERVKGVWKPTDIKPVRTPSQSSIYVDLNRTQDLAAEPRHFRITVVSEIHTPYYRRTVDHLEFEVDPHNDDKPADSAPTGPEVNDDFRWLLPAEQYPFPAHLRVVRGVVHDAGGKPVANVEVGHGVKERSLSDAQGRFAVPIRWPEGPTVDIDATDFRSNPNRTGQVTVPLPDGLAHGHTIVIN